MIEPVYERLAEEKSLRDGRNGVAFAKIDIDVGLGRSIAAEWNIRATPTFYFFLDGKKVCANRLCTGYHLVILFYFILES